MFIVTTRQRSYQHDTVMYCCQLRTRLISGGKKCYFVKCYDFWNLDITKNNKTLLFSSYFRSFFILFVTYLMCPKSWSGQCAYWPLDFQMTCRSWSVCTSVKKEITKTWLNINKTRFDCTKGQKITWYETCVVG